MVTPSIVQHAVDYIDTTEVKTESLDRLMLTSWLNTPNDFHLTTGI